MDSTAFLPQMRAMTLAHGNVAETTVARLPQEDGNNTGVVDDAQLRVEVIT